MQNSEKRSRRQQAIRNAHYDEQAARDDYQEGSELPAGGSGQALLIGLIAGIVGALISIIITFLGSPLYQEAAREANNAAATTIDVAVSGLTCLGFFISLLVCFIAGSLVAKRAVLRKFGFFAGALAGAVMFLCSFLTRYIPNYPGNLSAQSTANVATVSRGLVASLVFLLIWFFIGGLIGLWGAASATRKHPYYTQRAE